MKDKIIIKKSVEELKKRWYYWSIIQLLIIYILYNKILDIRYGIGFQ